MTMIRNISTAVALVKVSGPTVAGTTTITPTAIDVSAYDADGIMFFTSFGTGAAGNKMYAHDSDDNSAFNDIAASTVPPGSTEPQQFIDIPMPQHRYVGPVFLRGTSTTIGDVWALLYRIRKEPVNNNVVGTMQGLLLVNPADGTR